MCVCVRVCFLFFTRIFLFALKVYNCLDGYVWLLVFLGLLQTKKRNHNDIYKYILKICIWGKILVINKGS